MKKLFTISSPVIGRISYGYLHQQYGVAVVNSGFLQNCVLNSLNNYDSKPEINIQLNSFNFFVHFATYRKVKPLLLTYSAEITHTYRQTLTTSFNFSRPADVLPSVRLGSIPKYIIDNNGCCNAYYSIMSKW